MSTSADSPLQTAREAIKRRAWREAFDLFTTANASEDLPAEDLENLAQASFCVGRFEDSREALERASAAYVDRGNRRRAAFVALTLARQQRQSTSVAAGWSTRAERLLHGESECVEHGYLAWAHCDAALARGEPDHALDEAQRMIAVGRQFGDRDLQALGLHYEGRIRVGRGEVAEGLTALDEAMAAAIGRELEPEAAGIIYCGTILVCYTLADYRRASEWIDAAERWCEGEHIALSSTDCRVHRAQILHLRGAWDKAEHEARRACDELHQFKRMPGHARMALYEIGEIRLRSGDLPTAEAAFQQAHEHGGDPQPGLALLRLAEGKTEAAFKLITRSLAGTSLSPLARARRLAAAVEIAIAAGELEAARLAAEELEGIAKTFGSPAFEAAAVSARGAVQLALGDGPEVRRNLARGVQLWQELDIPYEEARARVLLAAACRAEHDDEGAVLELHAARSVFDRLGAMFDVRLVSKLLEREAAAADPGLRQRDSVNRTFMFTDIVKSTTLVEAIGDEAWADLVRWHDQTLRSLFTEYGGEEVDHAGDGFFAAFDTATAAVECAVATQRKLADHRRVHGFAPYIRIGLHTASALRRGSDYKGKGVHEAARIAALAKSGEILMSETTLSATPTRFPVANLRRERLKGISKLIQVASIKWRQG